jgi:UDP-2-acetamido-3-amino-2,3-dideoxy-glucuronate N-acetyltransferase
MTTKLTPSYFIHETSLIDMPCEIGKGTKIWHFSHIMADCKIGENCNLGQNVLISSGVLLGNNVKVQNNVSIYTGVHCEDDVFLGPSMVFTNITNPRSAVIRKEQYIKTRLGKGVTVGANATLICGNNIGPHALIGAGAVITKPVLPYALVVGNPAKQIGWVGEYGYRLIFDKKNKAICKESKQEYLLENNSVKRIL